MAELNKVPGLFPTRMATSGPSTVISLKDNNNKNNSLCVLECVLSGLCVNWY